MLLCVVAKEKAKQDGNTRGKYKVGKKGKKHVIYVKKIIEIIFLTWPEMYFKEFGMFCCVD